jgi:hypothetical protein
MDVHVHSLSGSTNSIESGLTGKVSLVTFWARKRSESYSVRLACARGLEVVSCARRPCMFPIPPRPVEKTWVEGNLGNVRVGETTYLVWHTRGSRIAFSTSELCHGNVIGGVRNICTIVENGEWTNISGPTATGRPLRTMS